MEHTSEKDNELAQQPTDQSEVHSQQPAAAEGVPGVAREDAPEQELADRRAVAQPDDD